MILFERSARRLLRPGLIIVGLTFVGALLRFYRLDARSLWLDEMVTAHVIRFDRLSQVFDYLQFWVDNTPLIYVQTWLLRGFGGSEVAIRWPYALTGALNIPALYFLGRAIARPRVGLLAALLMAILPFAVWYSQEARSYADFMLFTTLQMLFAYLAVTRSRWYDWLFLALSTVLNLYTTYIALAVTAVVCVYVGIVLLFDVVGAVRSYRATADAGVGDGERRDSMRKVAAKLGAASAAAILTSLAYLPWLPTLQMFFDRKDLGFGLVAGGQPPTLSDLGYLLLALDLTTPMLILAFAGLSVCAVWLVRGHWREGSLIMLWIGFPLLLFWTNAHESMVQLAPRYYSFLYPAILLLVALGVEAPTWAAVRLFRGLKRNGEGRKLTAIVRRPAFASGVVFVVLALFLFAQAIPALANSYQIPKPDYRGTGTLIKSSVGDQANTVVLEMGMGSVVYFPESLQYYFDLWKSPIVVDDGRSLDYPSAVRLTQSSSAVWGLVYGGLSPDDMARANALGFEVLPMVGMTLLKPTVGTSVKEAEDLLRWGSVTEPRLLLSIDLLQAVSGALSFGANQLDSPARATPPATGVTLLGGSEPLDHWTLWPDTSVSPDGTAFHLVTDRQTINLTWLTGLFVQGGKYALFFRCRNADLVGDQRVYVSAHSGNGGWLDTFPNGYGYLCPKSTGSTSEGSQGFAFQVPAGTGQLRIWLRVTGSGAADFSNVELRQIR
jgi:4-amino-4-deoxy-L-arabinose transferase-like glycosyltransferase